MYRAGIQGFRVRPLAGVIEHLPAYSENMQLKSIGSKLLPERSEGGKDVQNEA